MVSTNETWFDDRTRTVWRSEFVECRHERANNSIAPQICLNPNKMFCCYNNALLDENDYCCSFDALLLEHRVLYNLIHLFVWINLIVIVLIIFASIRLHFQSMNVIEEDNSDNEELMNSIRHSEDKKKNLVDSLKEMLLNK